MTVWGYEYTENDDYYTNMGEFVTATIAQLENKLQTIKVLPVEQQANMLRITIIVTCRMLHSISYVVLTTQQKETILNAIQWCRELTASSSDTAENPALFIKYVDRDMQDIIGWVTKL